MIFFKQKVIVKVHYLFSVRYGGYVTLKHTFSVNKTFSMVNLRTFYIWNINTILDMSQILILNTVRKHKHSNFKSRLLDKSNAPTKFVHFSKKVNFFIYFAKLCLPSLLISCSSKWHLLKFSCMFRKSLSEKSSTCTSSDFSSRVCS